MNAELTVLLEQARTGSTDAYGQLVTQLRRRLDQQPRLLVDLAGDAHEAVQRAVIDAARNLTGPEVRLALEAIVRSPFPQVRQLLAYALTDLPGWPMGDLA